MRKFLFKFCRFLALVLSIGCSDSIRALSCEGEAGGGSGTDIRFGSAAYINSIRSYLGSADAIFVGTVEKLSEPTSTHHTGTMHLGGCG